MLTQQLQGSWEDKARSWGRLCLRLASLRVFLAASWIALVLLSGASTFFRRWLEKNVSMSIFAVAPVYLAAVIVSYMVISLPLDWFGWKAEVRYGLSRKRAAAWLAHLATESSLGMVFGVAFFFVVYISFLGAGRWWWLAAALISLGGDLLVRRFLLQRLISLRHPLTPIADAHLRQKLKLLAEKSGSKIETFLEMKLRRESPSANAMIGGLGGKKAIFVTDTLLDALSEEELESVICHELGHDRHSHSSRSLLLNFLWITWALFVAHLGLGLLLPVFPRLGIREPGDIAAFPILVFFLLMFAIFATPLFSAISRRMERSADAFALKLSGNPEAFSSGLEKLAEMNLIERDPPWVVRLISRAPALKERIEMAEAFHNEEEKT